MKQKYLIGVLVFFFLFVAGWQGWTWVKTREESGKVGQRETDPFASLVIPDAYAKDPAVKKILEDNIARAKVMYAEKPNAWET